MCMWRKLTWTLTHPTQPKTWCSMCMWRKLTWTLTHPTWRVFKNARDYWSGFLPAGINKNKKTERMPMDKIQHQTAKAERSALTTSFSSEGAAQGPPSRATKFAGHIANQPHAMKILLKPRRPSCYKSRYCHKIRCALNATTEKECK